MTLPLAGFRVVNTRATHQAPALDRLLRAHGAIPISYPCIAVVPPENTTELDASLDKLAAGEFAWLVLTSGNTVHALATRLEQRGMLLDDVKVAAIGPSTAEMSKRLLGLSPAFVPEVFTGAALAESLTVERGDRVLLPASDLARDEVATILRKRGAIVDVVTAYRTIVGSGGADLPQMLAGGEVDALTFCSSSAIDGFVTRIPRDGGSAGDALVLPAICIGPKTYETALTQGFRSASAAEMQTLDGLIAHLRLALAVQPRGGTRWL